MTVASDLTATSFTDKTISAMNNYNYVLMATDGVKSSGAVTSNDVLAGEDLGVALPYENSFLGENGMGFFTTIDANEDGEATARTCSTTPARTMMPMTGWFLLS